MQVNRGEEAEIDVVGGSTFGRYPKIDISKTYNMFVSDNWLVNYPGFQLINNLLQGGFGRGIFNSVRGSFMLVVISSSIFKLDLTLNVTFVGQIDTTLGIVFMDENLNHQVCIVDGQNAYIYNYIDNSLTLQTLMFNAQPIFPSYVCYHNTFFLFGSSPHSANSQNWYVFQFATNSTISFVIDRSLQTKPDVALAVKRIPGRGNNVLVLGSTVAEVWTQVGGLEAYRRVQSFNIDNGMVSNATLAANDEYVCWLAQNENNAPYIMYTDGSSTKRISSDGIDFILSSIKYPGDSSAFFYRQDGHLFYQINFYSPQDNLSLVYDFTTQMFFHASDQNQNFYPALQNIFFNGAIYFVSPNDGGLYIMDTNYLTYNYTLSDNLLGQEIPRIRICKTVRRKNSDRFRIGKFVFTMEQGVLTVPSQQPSRVDMRLSKNGNQSFGNIVSRPLNPAGRYQNQIIWERLGQCNEITIQLSFIGFQRFVCSNGILEIF